MFFHILNKIKLAGVFAVVSSIILCMMFSGCTTNGSRSNIDGRTKIICTAYPQYDWVTRLTVGIENADIEYLLNKGTDIHSFQPSADDIIKINNCDLLVVTGGSSDTELLKTLQSNETSNSRVFNMMSSIHDLLLSTTDDHDEHDHTSEYDEHIWLSLKNAEAVCSNLCERLCEVFPDDTDIIEKNTEEYIAELKKLDNEYSKKFSDLRERVLIVADRFPFVYLAKDYSFDCFSAFGGCSSDTDVSIDKILELSSAVDKHNIKNIIVLKGGSLDIANAVKNNTAQKNQSIVSVDTLQSVSAEDIQNGTSYIDVMQNTLDALYNSVN